MRVERRLVGLFLAALVAAPGCGRLAYNLPPAQRILEPGPGVGGPGPGVIPPAGSMNGVYGGGMGRFGSGMGAAMGGPVCYAGVPSGTGNMVPAPTPNGVMQTGYVGAAEGCNAAGCGDASATTDPNIEQACFHHAFGGGAGCMRPGMSEASADGGMGGMSTSQIAFLGDEGVQVQWDISGSGMFDSTPLVIPGRQDFYQGAIYRLKVSNISGRAGVTLYPTLEVAPVTPRTDAFLAHSPIPVQFTDEDFDQVVSGNFVTKVIYLPDPEFQELALAGVETLVSTRLDPGVDPIAEADRRGSILAILRIGNKNLELSAGDQGVPGTIVPASHNQSSLDRGQATQAMYNESAAATGEPVELGVSQSQYCEEGYFEGAPSGAGYCDASMGTMPMGMPTGGFSPPAVPPNMMAGGPTWGMPITGTPIGLPGPPHVPLGSPAGLQKHVMVNKTRVCIPPPVAQMQMTVRQRPGLNYPRPVNHVCVDETQREPLRLLPEWLTNAFSHGGAAGARAYRGNATVGAPCPQ